jgi:2-phosphosulfolactate phosphatase
MSVLLDVAFLPRDLGSRPEGVAVVVDVIRASTSMVTLFQQGCPVIHVARTLAGGERFARARGLVLCGERGGARPEGFDYGNSPSEFVAERFDGRPVVLCTTNGTVALHAVAGAQAVFVGCLANAGAVVEAALAEARPEGRLTVVCAGREGRFALDDAWTAGRLIALARERLGSDAVLTDSARAAVALTRAEPTAAAAFALGGSARALAPLGLGHDVAFAAREDRSTVTPRLVARSEAARFPVLLVAEESEAR